MKHFILFLALASVGFSQGGNLSVNLSTGAIRGPVTAEQFKTANDLGGVSDFSELTGTPTTLLGYGITDGILASTVNGYFADPSTNGSFSASAWRSDLGGTTVGQNIFTVANPGAVRWLRINADNTVTLRTAAEARADLDLEAGTDFLAFPTGTPTGSKYLRDDNTWQAITGGDVTLTGTNVYTAGSSTFNSGTTVAFNGAVNMAPTGGTWDLSLLTISFGTLNVTTLNATGLNIGGDTLAEYIASLGYVSAGGNIGAATATTPAADDDSTKVATTAWVQDEISGLSGGSGIPDRGFLAWPTGSVGSPPSGGFLLADGTEGTDDASADNTAAITYFQKATGIAPTLSSATIGTDGETFTMVFSESVDIGVGGNAGFAVTMSTGSPTVAYASGDGSDTLVYTLSDVVLDTTTGTLAYIQPGNGVEDAIGVDLASFSGTSITNNSTQTSGPTLLASDNFNSYTNGAELGAQANWTAIQGSILARNTATIRPGGSNGAAYYDATTPSANHRVEITVAETTNEYRAVGPVVRSQGAAGAFYTATWGNTSQGVPIGGIRLKYVAAGGTETLLVADTGTQIGVGYKIALEATGTGSATRLTVQIDTGGGWTAVTGMTSYDPATDLDGGHGGVYLQGSGTLTTTVDDFKLYDL